MNYRHAFHAGNFADVFKHTILALLLERLHRKATPFCILDTHAGTGLYGLDSEEARRTGEAQHGIARLETALARRGSRPPATLTPFLETLAATRADYGPAVYPGSPLVIRHWLRPRDATQGRVDQAVTDRLVACEWHPDDVKALRRTLAGNAQTAVHHQDGYQGMKAHLPPRERRGLVLIDPPYEQPDEASRATTALIRAHKRWPGGLYALWYPIKERPWVWRLHEALAAAEIPRTLIAELLIHPEDDTRRLNGCGFVLVNPPWRLDQDLASLLPWLHQTLAPSPQSQGWRVDWLVPEPESTPPDKSEPGS